FSVQTVMAGSPVAFGAALILRRVRGYLIDAELVESVSELSGSLFSGQLFGKRPVRIVALEDGVAIAVEAERDTMSGNHGVERAEIAESVFGFELEVSGQDLAGRVVLKAEERKLGAAAFEPVMTAGIGEHHHAA